jgi:hypothetical protein
MADRAQRRAADLACGRAGNVVGPGEDLLRLLVRPEMMAAEMPSRRVPVKVLCLHKTANMSASSIVRAPDRSWTSGRTVFRALIRYLLPRWRAFSRCNSSIADAAIGHAPVPNLCRGAGADRAPGYCVTSAARSATCRRRRSPDGVGDTASGKSCHHDRPTRRDQVYADQQAQRPAGGHWPAKNDDRRQR